MNIIFGLLLEFSSDFLNENIFDVSRLIPLWNEVEVIDSEQ